MISWEEFNKIDIRAGTIVKSEGFPEAKKPAIKLWVDLGEQLGIKSSSAQITELYNPADILGRQVICVVNFPPKKIAGFLSEIPVTGFQDEVGRIVLASVDKKIPDGARLF